MRLRTPFVQPKKKRFVTKATDRDNTNVLYVSYNYSFRTKEGVFHEYLHLATTYYSSDQPDRLPLIKPLKLTATDTNQLTPPKLEDIRKRLGHRIRRQREKTGYSQDVLAELSGLNRSYIGALERGEHNPGINSIARVAQGLDISIDQLFAESQTDKKPQATRIEPCPPAQIDRLQFLQLLQQCAADRPDLIVIYLERFGINFIG